MKISAEYIAVKKAEQEKKEGFQTVDVVDNFVFKGEIVMLPEVPVYVSNDLLSVGRVVIFKKYSPDTVEIDVEGQKLKFVKVCDILAVI